MALTALELVRSWRGEKPLKKLEFQPWSVGKPLPRLVKQVLTNLMLKMGKMHPEMSVSQLDQLCSELTGIGKSSFGRIRKEGRRGPGEPGTFKTAGKTRPTARGAHTRMAVMDPLHKSGIRRTIHSFMFRNELPTMKKVLRAIEMDESLPNMSNTTLHRTLKDLGFRNTKLRKHPAIMLERDDITVWRRRHLREIRKFRSQGKKIYYTSETFVNSSHTMNSRLHTTAAKYEDPACEEGQSASTKQSNGPDARFIVLHIGSSDGFLEGGEMCIRAKKISGDFHREMNDLTYESWFTKILPRLEPCSIIVTDNASYHSVKVEQMPTKSWRKSAIQGWLRSKGVTFSPCMTIPELLVLVNEIKHGFNDYKLDVIAKGAGHTVLRVPPHHCELNPIEKIWSQIKGYVAKKNKTLEPDDVEKLISKAMAMVTKGDWTAAIDHVIMNEENCWKLDDLADDIIQQLSLRVDSDSECETSEEDEEISWPMSDSEPPPEDD